MQLTAQELNELIKDGANITVSNQQSNIVVFTSQVTGLEKVWAAKGDLLGKDVVQVPASLLQDTVFTEQLFRGIFAVEQAPEVLESALERQRAHWNARTNSAQNAEAELERSSAKTVAVGLSCIAPKGRELCGRYAMLTGKDTAADHPPLCSEHMSLAPQFAPSETGRLVDGKPEVIWRRATPVRA